MLPPLPCRDLGELVCWFWREYAWRVAPPVALKARATVDTDVSLWALVHALEESGFGLTRAEYLAIEAGKFPTEIGTFFRVFAGFLRLSLDEYHALWLQAAFDVLRPIFGDQEAWRCLSTTPLMSDHVS